MRTILALLICIYLIGVGVVLSPTLEASWRTDPASRTASDVAQALPYALAWPARAFHVPANSDRG